MELVAYEEARQLVVAWRQKDYAPLNGSQVLMPKCIDLHHASKLDEFYEKHTPCNLPKGEWFFSEKYDKNCT